MESRQIHLSRPLPTQPLELFSADPLYLRVITTNIEVLGQILPFILLFKSLGHE